jgi:hypothetical protein
MAKKQRNQQVDRAFWVEKVLVPIVVAIAVTLVGGASFIAVKDLKPIHLETGEVSFDVDRTDRGCLCRNTVRQSRLSIEAPVDVNGAPCGLPTDTKPHLDRAEIGPYFLTSQFMPNVAVDDKRCFRLSTISVKDKRFSAVPTVSLQLTWLDAITSDETEMGAPVLLQTPTGISRQKTLNVRFELLSKNITTDGFDIVLRTWNDSRIYAAKASYIAFIQ